MVFEQLEFGFRVVTRDGTVQLLVNNKEQIFVEKLKSLLRFGSASTRFKDVFDWIDESPNDVTARLVDFLSGI